MAEETDEEMLENLDLLLNYDALKSEGEWEILKDLPEQEKAGEIEEEGDK